MESQKLDIVELIEINPITKLSKNYQGKFIEKIQQNFTEAQQKLFIASFYCYLNYNCKTDFVIDMGDIWKWLGFSRKEHCKVVLEKHFKLEIDYKIFSKKTYEPKLATATSEASLKHGGQNKEKILMNLNTFKKLCLKSNTKKADEIHDYFIKLEEITQEIVTEESNDLKLQLEDKKKQFIKDRQQILLDSFHQKCIVYLIKITNTLFKFGNSDDIKRRLQEHRREINNDIELVYCIESKNNVKLENDLKDYLKSTNYRKEQVLNGKNQTELIEINDIKDIHNELEKLNKDIREDKEYLVIERLKLEIELQKLKNKNQQIDMEPNDEDKKEEQEIYKEFDEIKNLTENNQEEIDQKVIKLEALKTKQLEQARKRVEKYRKSEKFKQYIQTDGFKQKERQRYQRRKETDQYKNYRQKYVENNKEKIKELKECNRKKKCKTTLVNTEAEKTKFKNWLELNIKQEKGGKLIWRELLDKFLGYSTSALISKIYKNYFIEYTTEKYPNIKTKYMQFKLNNKNPWGYKNFTIN
jgi:hypothetical protein